MQFPILATAALVTARASALRDLFGNRCQFRHFQNYLTGLMVLSPSNEAGELRPSARGEVR